MNKFFTHGVSCFVVSILFFGLSSCKKEVVSVSNTENAKKMISYGAKSSVPVDSIFQMQEVAGSYKERERLSQTLLRADFSETGFYLAENGKVSIDVEILDGTRAPELVIGTLSRYAKFGNSADGGLQYERLKAGRNTITATKGGGLMYLKFSTDFTSSVQKSKVTFVTGMQAVPYFKLGETTNEQWKEMLARYSEVPDVMISTKHLMLVVSYKNAVNYQNEDLTNLLKRLESAIDVQDKFAGFDGSSPLNTVSNNKILMTEMDKGPSDGLNYMFAWEKRIAINQRAMFSILTANGFNGELSYGVFHELGHMQQQMAWTWSKAKESNVNLYAIVAQKALGTKEPNLGFTNRWDMAANYLKLNNKNFNTNNADFTDPAMDIIRTCMFQQLWLQYGDQFYAKVHKYVREYPNDAVHSDVEKMTYFMLITAKVSGNDLTDFFKKWGFVLPESSFLEVKNLGLPKPNIDISKLRA